MSPDLTRMVDAFILLSLVIGVEGTPTVNTFYPDDLFLLIVFCQFGRQSSFKEGIAGGELNQYRSQLVFGDLFDGLSKMVSLCAIEGCVFVRFFDRSLCCWRS